MILALEASSVLTYIYDLGHAHGRGIYNNLEEFSAGISNAVEPFHNRAICAWTNSGQMIERDFLRQIGFHEKVCDNRMSYHSIGWDEWSKFNENIKELLEALKKAEKERIEKLWAGLRESEAKEGRKKDELRVGDLIYYGNWGNDLEYKIKVMSGPNIGAYKITRILPSGRVRFVLCRNDDIVLEGAKEYTNYDTADGGYPTSNCIRPQRDWK